MSEKWQAGDGVAHSECLLRLSPEPVLLIEGGGRIYRVNQHALELFGYTAEELVGQTVEVLVPDRMRGAHARLREGFTSGGENRKLGSGLVVLGRRRDGREIPLDIMLSPYSDDGRSRYIVMIRDVSGQHALMLQAREQAERLERLNQAKDHLLGVAAHDLRNPLSVIRAYSELLSDGVLGELNDKQQAIMQHLLSSSDYMASLVNDLLDYAAIESGRLQLRPQRLELEGLVREAVSLERSSAERKGSRVLLQIEDELPPLELDPFKIQQVLHNLVSNAVKYSPPGAITTVRLWREGDRVHMAVTDRGPGLSEQEQARIFEPFGRASARPTAGETSTGLGLAIASRIVRAHGGTLEVDSVPGAGATFTVRLPC